MVPFWTAPYVIFFPWTCREQGNKIFSLSSVSHRLPLSLKPQKDTDPTGGLPPSSWRPCLPCPIPWPDRGRAFSPPFSAYKYRGREEAQEGGKKKKEGNKRKEQRRREEKRESGIEKKNREKEKEKERPGKQEGTNRERTRGTEKEREGGLQKEERRREKEKETEEKRKKKPPPLPPSAPQQHRRPPLQMEAPPLQVSCPPFFFWPSLLPSPCKTCTVHVYRQEEAC